MSSPAKVDAMRLDGLTQDLDERALAVGQTLGERHIEHAGGHPPPVVKRCAGDGSALPLPRLVANRLHDEAIVAPPLPDGLREVRGRAVVLDAIESPRLIGLDGIGIVARGDDAHARLCELAFPV